MSKRVVVKRGDCLSSIAAEHGFTWQALWNHPDNAELKARRKDPNVLFPRDVVQVPDKHRKIAECGTEATHRFRRHDVPALFRMRMLSEDGEPFSVAPYELIIDGESVTGTTDGDGAIEVPLPPGAREGELILTVDDEVFSWPLYFGELDPIDTDEGVKGRLSNLGYADEDETTAIQQFQSAQGLEPTGELDAETRSKVESEYGS